MEIPLPRTGSDLHVLTLRTIEPHPPRAQPCAAPDPAKKHPPTTAHPWQGPTTTAAPHPRRRPPPQAEPLRPGKGCALALRPDRKRTEAPGATPTPRYEHRARPPT